MSVVVSFLGSPVVSPVVSAVVSAVEYAVVSAVVSAVVYAVCRLAWCVQHHVSSRSTILLFYHGSRHSLDIQMEPYINHSV